MRNIPISIVFIFIYIICFSGCEKSEVPSTWTHHESFSEKTLINQWENTSREGSGVGVGYVAKENLNIHPFERPSNALFHVDESKFQTYLVLVAYSSSNDPIPVAVSLLLDYRQVEFQLDDKNGHLHYFLAEPGVNYNIPIEIDLPQLGWHDLVALAFVDPLSHAETNDSRQRLPPLHNYSGRRTVVCHINCNQIEKDIPAPTVATEFVDDQSGFSINGFVLSEGSEPPNERLMRQVETSVNEPISFELWFRNGSSNEIQYLGVPFLDFEQIRFNNSEQLHVIVPPQSEIFINGVIEPQEEIGIHELQFIYVRDPYQSLDKIRDSTVGSEMNPAIIVHK